MSPTNETTERLNLRAQQLRVGAGEIDPAGRHLTVGVYTLHVGDEIATRQNDRNLTTDRNEMVRNRAVWMIRHIADDAGLDIVLAIWSEIAAALRSEPHCQRLLDELTPLDGTQLASGGMHLGSAARVMALLHNVVGNDAKVDELFARAVQEHEALQSPPWVARTHLDWADVCARRGDLNDVEAHLDAARVAIGALVLPDLQRRLDDRATHAR